MPRVLETNVLHASDIVHWLDGTSGTDGSTATMQRVDREVVVAIRGAPPDLGWLRKLGQLALWRRPLVEIVAGVAGAAQRARPTETPFRVHGLVSDPQGYFNPRRFDLMAGNAQGHALALYPSPRGVRLGRSGGLLGALRHAADGAPACWALLRLAVTVGLGEVLNFHAQTDARGEFVLSLSRLPPLAANASSFAATLAVEVPNPNDPDNPVDADHPGDPDDMVAMQLGRTDAASFDDAIGLNIVPGEIRRVDSFDQDHLAVRPDS